MVSFFLLFLGFLSIFLVIVVSAVTGFMGSRTVSGETNGGMGLGDKATRDEGLEDEYDDASVDRSVTVLSNPVEDATLLGDVTDAAPGEMGVRVDPFDL